MVRGRVVKGLGAREKLRSRAREKLRARAMEKLLIGKKEYGEIVRVWKGEGGEDGVGNGSGKG